LYAPVACAQGSYREDTNQKQLYRNVIATMSTHAVGWPNETQDQRLREPKMTFACSQS